MICLGVEGTAHTLGVGIVDDKGNVLANAKDVFKPRSGYGIVPVEAAAHHREVFDAVLEKALTESKVTIDGVDTISYSRGPGLPPCLKSCMESAAALARAHNKPLLGVSHIIGHIEIGKVKTGCRDPVILYVSGGNTQVIAFTEGRYRVFGESEDIAIGNAQDTFARNIGLDFPGGPKLDELAKSGRWIEFPYVVKGMNLSFTGIVTEALKKHKAGAKLEDVAFSMNETMYAMLAEVTERALAHTEKNELLLTGGVAASKRLQEMLKIMCDERGAAFFAVPREYANDNGAMIAWAGALAAKSGQSRSKSFDQTFPKFDIRPRWRLEDVEVLWL